MLAMGISASAFISELYSPCTNACRRGFRGRDTSQ